MNRRAFLAAGGGVLLLGAYGNRAGAVTDAIRSHGPAPHHTAARLPALSGRAAAAVAYARAQSGKPYLWGGTGPDAFDCSGLVMMAYRAAGVNIPRTSEEQWAAGHRVSTPQAGDLVFFAGSDGTWQKPGHVAIVTGPHLIIQAYAPGTPIGAYPYGVPSALDGTGPGTVIGYTRPWLSADHPAHGVALSITPTLRSELWTRLRPRSSRSSVPVTPETSSPCCSCTPARNSS